MLIRELLIEGPVQDNQRALKSYFAGEASDLKMYADHAMEDYASWMNLFTQIIKPNINPAVAGRYMNFWSTWGRYNLGSLYIGSMSEQGQAKFKKFLDKHDLPIEDERWSIGFTEDVQHFYNNTPYNSVKNWVPDHLIRVNEWKQTLEDIIGEERFGQEEVIDHSDEDSKGIEPIDLPVKLPNGMMWFNLNRNYCDREGAAMGHCGNAASYTESDTVLSLREPKGQNHWRPVATFILDKRTGLLGEMKGRANQKPTSEYHPAILALLRYYDPILGTEDKGYLPQNNFDIFKDVPNSNPLKQEILNLKPRMFGKNIRQARELMSKDGFENYINDLDQQIKQKFGENASLDVSTMSIVIDSAENDRELVKKITGDPDIVKDWIDDYKNNEDFQAEVKDVFDSIRDRVPAVLYDADREDLVKTIEMLDREDSETVDQLYQDYFNMVYDQYINDRVSDALADAIMTAEATFNIKASGGSQGEPIQLYVPFNAMDEVNQYAKRQGFRNYSEYYQDYIIPDIENIFKMGGDTKPDEKVLWGLAFKYEPANFEKFADEWIRKNVPSGSLMTDSVNRMKQLAGIQL